MDDRLELEGSETAARRRTPAPAWLGRLVHLMDTAIPLPFTRVRMGVDAILGLIAPGAGDAAAAASQVALLLAAFRARVPAVIIARMVLNVAIDALGGVIPIAGDLFDVAFKANVRNLELLEREARDGRIRATAGDYAAIGLAIAAVLLLLSIPLLVAVLVARALLGG